MDYLRLGRDKSDRVSRYHPAFGTAIGNVCILTSLQYVPALRSQKSRLVTLYATEYYYATSETSSYQIATPISPSASAPMNSPTSSPRSSSTHSSVCTHVSPLFSNQAPNPLI